MRGIMEYNAITRQFAVTRRLKAKAGIQQPSHSCLW